MEGGRPLGVSAPARPERGMILVQEWLLSPEKAPWP